GGLRVGGLALFLLRAHVVVAVRAVDGPVPTRDERHLGRLRALGAGGDVQLPGRAAAVRGVDAEALGLLAVLGAHHLALGTARRAAHRVMLEPLGRVELLLAGREDEGGAAVATVEFAVSKSHRVSYSVSAHLGDSRRTRRVAGAGQRRTRGRHASALEV